MARAARLTKARSLAVDLQRAVAGWAPTTRDVSRWAGAALGARATGAELAVRIVGLAESRRLNRDYRRRDKPTNVLSFPVADALAPPVPRRRGAAARGSRAALRRPLGDLVVCGAVVRAEAREQAKPLRAHWAHLIVHGTLHLVGYDHERERDARRMERREIGVLRRLGFRNPYVATPTSRGARR